MWANSGEDQKKKGLHQKRNTFFSPKSGEDQKKRSSPGTEHFFSSTSSEDLRLDAHRNQIIAGVADEDHT